MIDGNTMHRTGARQKQLLHLESTATCARGPLLSAAEKVRRFIREKVILLSLGALGLLPAIAFSQSSPPNVIVILTDDLGYGDVGFNGCTDIPTPNIDALAANGALCTNGYACHPFCSPSRAGLLTGRYQQRFGHETNPEGDALNPLLGVSPSEILLPQLLKPAGYACDAIGKWHLGSAYNLHPLSRGFDSFYGFLGGASTYFNAPLLQNETKVTETSYLTDGLTREAINFINSHLTQPFFLYLSYNAPHAPYEAAQNYLDRVSYITDINRRTLAAMEVAVDDGVGSIVQTLQANNLLNNTLIFFMSDNGAPVKGFTSNLPLRGFKMNTLEGGIRVPFAVQWTGQIPANTIYTQPVSAYDVVPTVVAAAGLTLPTDREYDGINILPYLTGQQTAPQRTLFWRWFGLGPTGPPGSDSTIYAVRNGSLKLVIERGGETLPPELFNLDTDIGERHNLALSDPSDVQALSALYSQWNTKTIPPLWPMEGTFPTTLVLAGDWNGYNKTGSGPPWQLTRFTAPAQPPSPDGSNWFTTLLHVASSGGDTTPGQHQFALVANADYSSQWGGVTLAIDGTTALPYYSGTSLAPTNSITFDDGFYYSFRILDPLEITGDSLYVSVMKTSAPPVTVSRSAQTPVVPGPSDPVTVSISLSQPKCAEERIFVRWTNDSFVTSNLISATGSDTSYSATIPAQQGAFLQYSVISSTVDLGSTQASGIIDPLVLATSTVFNAIDYAPPTPTPTPSPPPTIVTQPASVAVTQGKTAKFSVVATGVPPVRYQWSKNSVPITGAIRPNYTTPATTATDNGAIFNVVVSDINGSTTSNNAILTVKPPPVPPSITVQPTNQTVPLGKRAKFSVTVTGSPILYYQWTKNGITIPGATGKAYTTPATTTTDNGALFAVTVWNSLGSVTSDNAVLTVQ